MSRATRQNLLNRVRKLRDFHARKRSSRGDLGRHRSIGRFEQLEPRAMLAGGMIELGPSDNVALDQPRVAIELIKDTGATAYRYDFGPVGSAVESGFVGASTAAFDGAFGWQAGANLGSEDRATGSNLNRDFVSVLSGQATFSRAVTNGTYQVQVHLGDLVNAHDDMAIWFEGETSSAHPWVDTAAGQVVVKSYTAAVSDGRLDIHLQDMGGTDAQLALVGLEIVDLGAGWASVGPGVFNTFLLDTGANSVLAMASAVGDMEQLPVPYETQGTLEEVGVAGSHMMDISVDYRFDFAGSSGTRHTLFDTRIQSDANNDFSIFGPWGLAGMPAMAGRVTTLDMTGWSGGGVALEDIYMKVDFSEDMPPEDVPSGESHRYALSVDNRLAFDPLDYLRTGEPPVWADIPFLTAIPTQNGIGREGNFLFDTGAQMSVISERLAMQLGLDTNGDGLLGEGDDSYVTTESIGGVGGTVPAPVFMIDEVHVPVTRVATGEEVELVWTNLQWLVLDIETDETTTLDGVFGSDLLTSGWFHAFFYGLDDGYFNRVHFDFQDWELHSGTPEPRSGTVYFDLNPLKDRIVEPGPGVRVRHSGGSTQVAENGGTDTYSIALTGEPLANVTIRLGNTDGQITAVNQADGSDTLVFTPSNWDIAQAVRVTGNDDQLAEGSHTGVITHTVTSSDPAYDHMAIADMVVSIVDDDLNLITITADQAGTELISSIHAAEGGGEVTYWMALADPPAGETWVAIEDAADVNTGVAQATVYNSSNPLGEGFENVWVFTPSNYNVPQPVRLAAVNDPTQEGPHGTQLIHTVLDPYTPWPDDPTIGQTVFPVSITDNDLGHVTITETNQSTLVVEGADTDTYQIALDLAPVGGPVEITVTAGSQLELSVDGGATFGSALVLSFTDTRPQTIAVRAFDDLLEEGAHTGRITHAITGTVADARYPTTLPIQSVSASILDNDAAAGLTISSDAEGQNAVASIAAVEGADVNYWVALNSRPDDNVTVYLASSSDQVKIVDAANPANAFISFTPENATTPQAIRVSTVDDGVVEGTQAATITVSAFSKDPEYQGTAVSTMTVADPVVAQASIVGRRIFYNNSYFDGNDPAPGPADDGAIATDKMAFRPGETATFEHVTSYLRGINGIMVDINGLINPDTVVPGDFSFRVSSDGTTWTPAPVPTMAPRRMVGDSDRFTFIWPDAQIKNKWLEVMVDIPSLAQPDVFYFGSLVGETGLGNAPGSLTISISDVNRVAQDFNKLTPITHISDVNRNGVVDISDVNAAAQNFNAVIPLIAPSSASMAGSSQVATDQLMATDNWENVRTLPGGMKPARAHLDAPALALPASARNMALVKRSQGAGQGDLAQRRAGERDMLVDAIAYETATYRTKRTGGISARGSQTSTAVDVLFTLEFAP